MTNDRNGVREMMTAAAGIAVAFTRGCRCASLVSAFPSRAVPVSLQARARVAKSADAWDLKSQDP
jgi:hypothetical protein